MNVYAFITYFNSEQFQELHYGFFDNTNDDLVQAQKNSTDMLLGHLLKTPAKLLEVGIGLGQTHQKLIEKGFDCIGLTPDPVQIEIVKEKLPKANLICTKFEDLDTIEKFDIVLLQESSQYIEPYRLFEKAYTLLKENGQVLIVDEFSMGSDSLHEIQAFIHTASVLGFSLYESKDLSIQVKPMETYILEGLRKHSQKLQNTLDLDGEAIEQLVDAVLRHQYEYKKEIRGYFFLDFRKKDMNALLVNEQKIGLTTINSAEVFKTTPIKKISNCIQKKALIITTNPLSGIGGIEKINQHIVHLLDDYNWNITIKSSNCLMLNRHASVLNQFESICQVDWQTYDLVITNNYLGGRIYQTNRTKVVTLVHGVYSAGIKYLTQWVPDALEQFEYKTIHNVEKMTYCDNKKIVVVSKKVQDELQQCFDVQSTLVNNGFDFDLFDKKSHAVRDKYGIPSNKLVALYAGRWSELEKRPDIIIKLSKYFSEIIWIFAVDYLPLEFHNLGNVITINEVPYDEMPTIYASVNFTVQLSFYEGFSNFAMESIASKTPMISTRTGIIDEVYTGTQLEDLLIEQHYDREIIFKSAVEKITHLINEYSRYKRFSEDLWYDVHRKFSLERWKSEMIKVLGIND